MFSLFSKKESKELSNQELAGLLKVHPEELKRFEAAYQNILDIPDLTDNLLDRDAGQSISPKDVEEIKCIPEEMVERIVQELLDGTAYYKYEDGQVTAAVCHVDSVQLVTREEIQKVPEGSQPQLTGSMIKRDIPEDASQLVLYSYKRYLEEKNKKKKLIAYQNFRVGLDTMDLDLILYEMLGMNRNSMGHWLPSLAEAVKQQEFFKIPNTTVIKVPLPLLQLSRLDYGLLTPTTLKIVDRYCQEIFQLDENREYFVKTGVFSSKFNFRNAHIDRPKEVRELGEYLLFISNQAVTMASYFVFPHTYGAATTNEWVVREYIKDVEENPCIYKGLPLHTEYRIFVDFDKKTILGIANYWDPQMMRQRFGHEQDADSPHNIHDYVVYDMHEPVMSKRYNEHRDLVREHVEKLLPHVELSGQWSMDIMQNGEDFFIIDMALAENSALNECVSKGLLKNAEENWLPDLSDQHNSTMEEEVCHDQK